MATYTYKKEEDYTLKSKNSTISVSVISGNGQGGSYFVLKDFEIIGANETVIVGKADEFDNNSIQVMVTIQDKLIETNWTGVIVIISEGKNDTIYTYAEELPADKDIAFYFITIKTRK